MGDVSPQYRLARCHRNNAASTLGQWYSVRRPIFTDGILRDVRQLNKVRRLIKSRVRICLSFKKQDSLVDGFAGSGTVWAGGVTVLRNCSKLFLSSVSWPVMLIVTVASADLFIAANHVKSERCFLRVCVIRQRSHPAKATVSMPAKSSKFTNGACSRHHS